jgi:CDP-diacylglycerol pyrophosphatase
MSPDPRTSTTLAELIALNPDAHSAVGTLFIDLLSRERFDNGAPDRRESWLRRSPLDFFFPFRLLETLMLQERVAQVDPFKLLRRGNPSNRLSMGRQTLAVVGATFHNGKSGFYVLANDTRASPSDTASAEALVAIVNIIPLA